MDHENAESVVRAAMRLFWQRGTSVPMGEIVAETGLSRKALYAACGDKATLLGAALGLYRRDVLDPLLALLDTPDGVRRYWNTSERAARDANWRGCLLMRAGTGPARGDPHVKAAFDAHARRFVAAMEAAHAREGAGGAATALAWASLAQVIAISALASRDGYDQRVAALFDAGRALGVREHAA